MGSRDLQSDLNLPGFGVRFLSTKATTSDLEDDLLLRGLQALNPKLPLNQWCLCRYFLWILGLGKGCLKGLGEPCVLFNGLIGVHIG